MIEVGCFDEDETRCEICILSFSERNRKPSGLCETCEKAIKDAKEQRIYSTITFPNKLAEEKYNQEMESLGFNCLNSGPTINID